MKCKSRGILFDPIQTDIILHEGDKPSTFIQQISLVELEDIHANQNLQSKLIKIEY